MTTKVAIVYHSGYGHTAVLADKVAEGVRDAGQTPVLLQIESAAQDFKPIIDAVTEADATDNAFFRKYQQMDEKSKNRLRDMLKILDEK
jgi:flavorubredoxin